MIITLTPAQWNSLKDLVIQAKFTEAQLGTPLEIINGDQAIEIKPDETKITLED